MAIIYRIDVDAPYGSKNTFQRNLSRVRTHYWFPKILPKLYLGDFRYILSKLEFYNKTAIIFFRRYALPSKKECKEIESRGHQIGLHMEDSRNYLTFLHEVYHLYKYLGHRFGYFTKHGSGKKKFGWWHYAPYEPKKYIEWGKRIFPNLKFFGNNENPENEYSAYWLERPQKSIEWLLEESKKRDIVLLFHPEGMMRYKNFYHNLIYILQNDKEKNNG